MDKDTLRIGNNIMDDIDKLTRLKARIYKKYHEHKNGENPDADLLDLLNECNVTMDHLVAIKEKQFQEL